MSFDLTLRAQQSAEANNITPQIVLEIDGVSTLFGAVTIKKIVKIGDFNIGDPGIYIGGQVAIEDQESLISLTSGTSSEISQTLNLDKGTNESISSMKIALLDEKLKATKLITPGEVVPDILGRRCKIWMGFSETSWRDDYIIIFRGFIDQVEAKSGIVTLNIASPDALKRGSMFPKGSTELTAAMTNSQTTADVTSTAQFLSPYIGPSGVQDSSLKFYIRIDDEIMRYESVTGTQFGTITRAQLGTLAATHDDEASVESFYTIEGNAIDLALKLMASGMNGPYLSNIQVSNFVRISDTETVPNAIFFSQLNIKQRYNPVVGDYITTTGSAFGANNVTLKQITEIVETDLGYYIVISGVSFVEDTASTAVIAFRSQYDVYGANGGLAMSNEEIDIDEHLYVKSQYFSSNQYLFYLKDTIESGKDFLSEQIYNPISAFAIPRKAQASIGVHVGPIPGANLKTLNTSNVIEPSKLNLQRTVNKNFFNSIIYRWDVQALEDRYKAGDVVIDGTSVAQIPVGKKPLLIDADGFRNNLSALNQAQIAGSRRLRKYKFGAEYIQGLNVNFKTGFDLEIGDKVVVDLASLKIADINTGSRDGEARLFEISNKKLNIATGKVTLDIVDTNYSLDTRYSVIGPASFIKTGIDNFSFIIKPSFNTDKYGTNEYKKWEDFIGAFVVVRSSDYSVVGSAYISTIVGNTITVDASIGFVPLEDYIIEFGNYDNQPSNIKLVYGFMSNGAVNFSDGKIPYQMS